MQDLKEINKELEMKLAALQERIEVNEYDIIKYRLANDAMRIGLWDMDVVVDDLVNPKNVFKWSQEFRSLLGFSDEQDFPDVLYSWSSRLHPDDYDRTIAAFAAHMNDRSGKTPYDIEYRLRMKNGDYRHFHALGTSVRDAYGVPLRVAGAVMDITDRKLLEIATQNALEESKRTVNTVTSVLNQSGAMIYVADPATDEILFMTDSMKAHYGIEGDVVGRRCYEMLQQGMDGRCDFCPCTRLEKDPGATLVWEERNTRTNAYYRKIDRLIDWPGGEKVRIQYLTDLTDMKRVQERLGHRENLLDAFNKMDMALLSQKHQSFEDAMGLSLMPIADAVGLDRIDIYSFVKSGGEQRLGQVYRWEKSEGGLTFVDENFRILPDIPVIDNWIRIVSEGDIVNLHTGSMTAEEFAFLNPMQIQSMLIVPVHIHDELWGMVVFQDFVKDRLFDEDSIAFLIFASRLCADAIVKSQIKNELVQTEERLRLMMDSAPFCAQLWDSAFNKIDCNSEAIRLFGFRDKDEYLERYPELSPLYQPDGELSEEKIARYFRQTIDEGKSSFDWTYRMLDGTAMPAKVVLVKVAHGDGFAITGFTRDLRDHNRMMKEINERTEELALQRATLSTIIDSIPDLIFCKDMDSRYTLFNAACIDFLNTDMESVLGKNDHELDFPEDTMQGMLSSDSRIFSGAHKVVYDDWIPSFDGRMRYFETTKAPLVSDGAIVGLVGVSRDITDDYENELELKRAYEQNELQLAKLNLMVKSARIGLWEVDFESSDFISELNTFSWSDDFRRLLGYTDENDFPNLLNSQADRMHPADRERVFRDFVEHLSDTSGMTPYDTEFRMRRKDGGYGYFRETCETIRDEDGNPVRSAGALIDITEIKLMNEELSHNQRMLHAINSAASHLLNSDIDTFEGALWQSIETLAEILNIDRITIWKNSDLDGRLYCTLVYEWAANAPLPHGDGLTVNVAYGDAIPGWEEVLSDGDCINSLVRDLPPRERGIFSRLGVLSVLAVPVFVEEQFWGFVGFDNCTEEKLFTMNEESILSSGSVLFVNAWIRNEMLTSLRDTSTQLEVALDEAKHANEAKGSFLRTVSHEIRTPMNVILGLTDIQLQSDALDDGARETFDRIHVAGDMLLGIINDILDMSKIEAGKLEVVSETYETASLISDTVHTNVLRVGSNPIEFRLHVDENMPSYLLGDALRIRQILNNLLSNAFKYTDSGAVSLSFYTESVNHDDSVTLVIEVSDTGQGMTADQLERLFDMYTRFNLDSNHAVAGTGLGMSILKNLLDLMNGEILMESEPGKGSRFTVRLPQNRVGQEVLGGELARNLQQFDLLGTRQMRRVQITREPMPYGSVLVVDDVESNLGVARGLLAPYGLKIDTAQSGFEAIGKIERGNEYDIIFMDHMMPKMDGIQATKIIKEKGYQYPIVALTANAVIGNAEMFMKSGFDDFISKPIDLRQLNTVLNRFVRDRHPALALKAAAEQKLSADGQESVLKDAAQGSLPAFEAFVRDASRAVSVLERISAKELPWSEEDKSLFEISAHGMKSALLIVGKPELSALAYRLEKSAHDGDVGSIKLEAAGFLDSLRAVIAGIVEVRESLAVEMQAGEKSHLRQSLLAIRAACLDYDTGTVDMEIKRLRERSWSESTQALLATIARDFLDSDFAGIVLSVDRFLDGQSQQ